MAQCPNCKSDLADGTVVCVRCGTNIESGSKLGMEVRAGRKRRRSGGPGLNLTWPLIIGIVIVIFCYRWWKADEARRVAEFEGETSRVSGMINQSDKLAKDNKFNDALSKLYSARKAIEELQKKYEGKSKIGQYEVQAKLDELIQSVNGKTTEITRKRARVKAAEEKKRREQAEVERWTRMGYARLDRSKISSQQFRYLRISRQQISEKGVWLSPKQFHALGYEKIGNELISFNELRKKQYAYFQGNWITPQKMKSRGYTWFENHWIPTLYYNRIAALKNWQLWSKKKKKWISVEDFLKTLPFVIKLKSGLSIKGYIEEQGKERIKIRTTLGVTSLERKEIVEEKDQAALYRKKLKGVILSTDVEELFELGKWWERARDCPNRRFLAYRCYEKSLRGNPINDDVAKKLNELADNYADEIASKSYKTVLKYEKRGQQWYPPFYGPEAP